MDGLVDNVQQIETFKYFITHMSNMLPNKPLDILECFADDYGKRVYGRYVAKKLKMNQKTVSNILNKLETAGILKFSIEGKNKYYYLNRFNSNIKEIIKLVEINRKMKFIERHKAIKDLFNKLEERAEGILVVFGSYASFSPSKNSDLDILVLGRIGEIEDLERLYNLKINIVKIDKQRFNKDDILVKEIVKNHVILKGNEEFVNLIWQ